MATSSVYDFGRALTPDTMGRLLAPYDPLQRADSWIYRDYRQRFAFDYIARRQAMFVAIDPSTLNRLRAMENALGDTPAGYAARITRLMASADANTARQIAREGMELFPDDQALRYTYIRPWLGPLARGTAGPEVNAAAKLLSEAPAALLRAAIFKAREDFQSIADLDATLARVPWTAAWKLDAVQVRADWRGRVADIDLRKRAGEECIALIDAAILVQPTLALYDDRARCALGAAREDMLIESLWFFAQGTYARSLGLTHEERARAARDLSAVTRVLRQTSQDPDAGPFDPARLRDVLGKLDANIEHLKQL